MQEGHFPADGRPGGWIEVIAGVMFSGKSEELIRRVRRAMIAKTAGPGVQVAPGRAVRRASTTCPAHDGRTVEAVPVDSPAQIARELLRRHAGGGDRRGPVPRRGRRGRGDRARRPAGRARDPRRHGHGLPGRAVRRMPQLMAVAEMVDKLHAICVVCGNPASRNQRLHGGKARALRLAGDHGRRARTHTRRAAAAATTCRAATRTRSSCSERSCVLRADGSQSCHPEQARDLLPLPRGWQILRCAQDDRIDIASGPTPAAVRNWINAWCVRLHDRHAHR